MGFSEAPLWWRVLVIAITLAILWVIYAVVAWIVPTLPDTVSTVGFVLFMAASAAAWIIGARRDRLKRRNEIAEGRVLEGRPLRSDLGSNGGVRPGEQSKHRPIDAGRRSAGRDPRP